MIFTIIYFCVALLVGIVVITYFSWNVVKSQGVTKFILALLFWPIFVFFVLLFMMYGDEDDGEYQD